MKFQFNPNDGVEKGSTRLRRVVFGVPPSPKTTASFRFKHTALALLLAGGVLSAPAAFANAVRFDFGPAGSPSVTALFVDVAPGQINLTVTGLGLSGNNSVNSLFFCLNPLLDSKDLVFTQTGVPGGPQGQAFLGNDSFKSSGGSGKFDIDLTFGKSPVFDAGDVATFSVTGISGLSVNDFLFQETVSAGHRPTFAAGSLQELSDIVIIQGVPNTGDGPNGPNAPDIASTFGLLVLGLVPLGWMGRTLQGRKKN